MLRFLICFWFFTEDVGRMGGGSCRGEKKKSCLPGKEADLN